MKKTFLFATFILIVTTCFSQDYISLKDGGRLEVIITETTPTMVKYRLYSNPTGKEFFAYKSSILGILYQDGKMETFTDSENQNTTKREATEPIQVALENQNQLGDFILLKDGTKKTAIVLEIMPDIIKYRDVGNPTGAIYTVSKVDVAEIVFENGKVETFTDSALGEMGVVDGKFFIDGKKLSSSEVKDLFQGTNALALYNQSKLQKGVGMGCSILGGVFAGVGLGVVATAKESDIVESPISKSSGIICLVTGGIMITSGLVLTYQAESTRKKAVDVYNKNPKKRNDLSMNVGFIGNGVGMRLKF